MPFQAGHKLARGGRREGAGRKPSEVKQAVGMYWAGKRSQAEAVLNAALQLPDYAELEARLRKCRTAIARQAVIESWRAQNDVPWRERLKAAELVYAYCDGRPIQRVQAKVDSGNALALLDRADQADAARVAALGAQHRKD